MYAFPFIQADPGGSKKSHLETLRDMDTEVKSREAVEGIKGPSWFEDFQVMMLLRELLLTTCMCIV